MTPWDLKALPKPTRDLVRLKADIGTYGYCLIEAAYPPAEIEAFRARLAEQAEAERAARLEAIRAATQPAESD